MSRRRVSRSGEKAIRTSFFIGIRGRWWPSPRPCRDWDTEPHYIISTVPDYAAVAATYRQLGAGKAAVTPRIQAFADEITTDTFDRRKQAHRIYDWVSKHTRYVAGVLGNGGYVPHEAIKILENGYGDCKDHVVLLEALLKAGHLQRPRADRQRQSLPRA